MKNSSYFILIIFTRAVLYSNSSILGIWQFNIAISNINKMNEKIDLQKLPVMQLEQNNTVHFYTYCNTFESQVFLKGNKLKFGNLNTKVRHKGDCLRADLKFKRLFRGVFEMKIDRNTMLLQKRDGNVIYFDKLFSLPEDL